MSINHRKHYRVVSKLRCWCEGENVTVYARIGNLSEGGLFLRTSTPLRQGAKALLRFGDEPGIESRAEVRWSRPADNSGVPPGMGLQFIGIDEPRIEQIRRIIHAEQESGKNALLEGTDDAHRDHF